MSRWLFGVVFLIVVGRVEFEERSGVNNFVVVDVKFFGNWKVIKIKKDLVFGRFGVGSNEVVCIIFFFEFYFINNS